MGRLASSIFLAVGLGPGAAAACTTCDSDTAAQVRALVFGEDFLGNAAALAAPLPALAIALILVGFRPGGAKHAD